MTGRPGRGGSLHRDAAWARATVVLAALALAACDGAGPAARIGGPNDGADAAGADDGTPTSRLAETDVEAPEVFQVSDQGLWDGRPSLGGVWVAHPDVADPERVMIRNGDNGQFVIGALFRRERDTPGPAIQVSSDAAEALGMLAGAPATLDVTALRREEPVAAEADDPTEAPAVDPAADPDASLDDAAPEEAAPADPASADAVAAATAAIVEGDPPPSAPRALGDAADLDLGLTFIPLGLVGIEAGAQALAQGMTDDDQAARAVAAPLPGAEVFRVPDSVADKGPTDAVLVAS